MEILNLYSGLGLGRSKWGREHNITAVEIDEKIASKYAELYPNDKVIVGDAHEYLLDHYKEFGFIMATPPCQTHSRTNYFTQAIRKRAKYPDMALWQEIIFLNHFCKGLYCVENVISYYEPFIKPIEVGRHYLWANFAIPKIEQPVNEISSMDKGWNTAHSIPLEIRNGLNPELGLHILNCALGKFLIKKDTGSTNYLKTKYSSPPLFKKPPVSGS